MEEPTVNPNNSSDATPAKNKEDAVVKKAGEEEDTKSETTTEVANGTVISNGEVMEVTEGEQKAVEKKETDENKKEEGGEEVKKDEVKKDDGGSGDKQDGEDEKKKEVEKKPAINPLDERPMEMERSGGAKRALRIKLRGLPLDKYVRDLKSLYKLMMDLFVRHLEVRVPNVKSPIWGDKWLYLEMKTLADKKKVLEQLENYEWEEYTLTAQECLPATKFDLSSLYNDEDPVVTEDNVLSFFLKYRNLPYKYQLEMKMKRTQDAVSELLEHLRDSDTRISNYINQYPPIIEETVPSMLIDGYTIDNYFHIAKDKETNEIKIGLKVFSHGRSVIAPISECVNIPRHMASLAQAFVASLPEMEQLKLYDEETEEGDLLGIGIQMNFIGQLLLTVHVVREHIPTEVNVDSKDKKDSNKKGGPKGRNFNRNNKQAQSGQTGDQSKTEDSTTTEIKEEGGEAKAKEVSAEETVDEKKEESEEIKSDDKVKKDEEQPAATEKNVDEEKPVEDSEDKPKTEGEEAKVEDTKVEGEEVTEKMEVEEQPAAPPPIVRKVHISDQELKQILMDFYKKYGSDLGVESIYYKLCYYQNKKEVGNKFNEYVRVVGPACLHETLGGVSFMVNPERMWAPPNRSFEAILSVVERLGRIGPDTIVVLVSTDQRYVPLYLSKKCKEVIALGCWNFQTSYNAKRIADSKGCRNTEYCNVTGKLPVSVWNRLQTKQRVVAIFWDNAGFGSRGQWLNRPLGVAEGSRSYLRGHPPSSSLPQHRQRGGGKFNQRRGGKRGRPSQPCNNTLHMEGSFMMKDCLRSIRVYGYDGGGGFHEISLETPSGEGEVRSLMEIVWGRHNTTMNMEERYKVLGKTYPSS